MASAMPSTGNRHFRNYPLTGHIADIAQTTRMTPSGHWCHRSLSVLLIGNDASGKMHRGCRCVAHPLLTGFRLRHNLQQRVRADRDLPHEWPVVSGDQQHGRGHPGCKDPHRDDGS